MQFSLYKFVIYCGVLLRWTSCHSLSYVPQYAPSAFARLPRIACNLSQITLAKYFAFLLISKLKVVFGFLPIFVYQIFVFYPFFLLLFILDEQQKSDSKLLFSLERR